MMKGFAALIISSLLFAYDVLPLASSCAGFY